MSSIEITFRDVPSSTVLHDHAMKRAEKLTKIYQQINKCHVVIGHIQKHKHQGKQYSAHVHITVPEKTLVSTKKSNDDAYVSINEAFIAIERQLAEYVDKH